MFPISSAGAQYARGVSFARTERAQLCDLLDELGPTAPTLCRGWTTSHLAAHLWLRETDPLAMPGIVVKPLAGLTERRMASAQEKLGYQTLVSRVRSGPGRISVFALPGLDEAANAIEYFVHHEDVRRAGEGWQPRELPDADEDACWKRVGLMGRAMFLRSPVPVVAQRAGTIDRVTLKAGEDPVVLIGKPSELVLFLFGRRSVAQVEIIGSQDSVAKLEGFTTAL